MNTAGAETRLGPVGGDAAPWRGAWPYLAFVACLWVWVVCSNLPYWRDEPNYSYGWAVLPLAAYFIWRRMVRCTPAAADEPATSSRGGLALGWPFALLGLAFFPFEVYRVEYHQSGWVLWAVNLGAVGATLLGAARLGGAPLLRALSFPVLFCLTSAPWPAVLAGRVQQILMAWVANGVGETLLWSGIPVQMDGAVLHLDKGSVGIVEACSGIRSLQSGFMVSLAVGELLGLAGARRGWLCGLAALLALVSNFIRTLVLSWVMETNGPEGMHHWHDTVGNVAMYSLYFAIYGLGWLLEPKLAPPDPVLSRERWRALVWKRLPDVRPFLAGGAAAVATVHLWYWRLEATTVPQAAPSFQARLGADSGNQKVDVDPDVWERLGPTLGEQVRRQTTDAPAGVVEGYHFFWRPSNMSRVALHHRPDVCMPGSGWSPVGEVGEIELPLGGRSTRWHRFEFAKPGGRAIQVWGAWRNGRPVAMDFGRGLTALPERYGMWPTARHFMSVEVVSFFIPFTGERAPDAAVIARLLPELFTFQAGTSP